MDSLTSKGRSAAAVAAVVLLAVAGCSTSDGDDPAASQSSSARTMPAATPATYEKVWDWKVSVAGGSRPVVTDYGVFTIDKGSASSKGSRWRVSLTNPETGKRVWRSAAINGGSGERPKMALVRQGGQEWLVLWSTVADKQTQLVTVDPRGSGGSSKALTHVEVVAGTKAAPEVQATSGGVLVTGDTAAKKPYMYWPETGAKTTYDSGPSRGKDKGVPEYVYSNGWIVSFPGGGFAYATEQGGWDSATAEPPGADRQSGEVVAVTGGVLFSVWQGAKSGAPQRLVAQDVRSGRVLASVAEDPKAPFDDIAAAPVVSPDRRWAAMGGYTLNLHSGEGSSRDVKGAHPTFIQRDAIYYRGGAADPGQKAPAAPAPKPATKGSVPPAGAVFALDAETGTTVTARVKGVLVGVDSADHGLFIFPDSDRGGSVLYSASSK